MYVTFQEKYLQDLYEQGTTDDKHHRFQPDIVKRYKKCIDLMKKGGVHRKGNNKRTRYYHM